MKKIFYYVSALLLAGALSWSCSDDDNDGGDGGNGKGGIVLDKGTQTEQVVYANDKSGKNEGIKFTAQGPWKAEVKEVSTKADAAAAPTVDWLALSQYSGDKAGDYTITLTLKQNFTGKTRKAEIRIICGDTVITITIEQKAEKEDGKKLRRVKSVTWKDAYGAGYKEVYPYENEFESVYTYSYDEQGRVARVEVNDVASATEKETDIYRFDYNIVGEITVDHHHASYYIDQSGQKHEDSSDEKYFLTLNEQGNVVKIEESDDYDEVDRRVEYTADGRLAKLWEENDKDGYSWYTKFYYTDGLLTKGEFWERYSSDSTEIQEFDANVLYPKRYPSNGTNIDFNAFIFELDDDIDGILYQIGLLGKGSDCLMEIGIWDEYDGLNEMIPIYREPNQVHKYTKKYIKWPGEERILPMKYEFDGDKFVTKFWYEEPYELWEHKYEDHVGNVRENPDDPNSPYEFKRKTIYDKLLRSEKNTYSYTVVYE